MIRPSAALVVCGVLLERGGLAGCTDNAPPAGQPSFYHDLAQAGRRARRQRGAIDDFRLSQQ